MYSTMTRGLSMAVLLSASLAAGGENLLPDPSFEKTQPRDKFGRVLAAWQGWIYEGASRFEVGRVARTGEHSCEIVGVRGGKIRLQSKPLDLKPGRYRLVMHLRGLGIGKGRWGRSLDFSVGFDGEWHGLERHGTFGWTPLTYVFDIPADAGKPFQAFVGLWETGRLWVDDASLEKVDASVPLTPKPAWGKQEAPLAPPGKIKDLVRCGECGYRNDAAWGDCYACGRLLGRAGRRTYSTPPRVVFADFDDGKRSPFQAGRAIAEHATSGKYSLRVDKNWADTHKRLDFSEHDYFHIDVFNPRDEAAKLYVEIRDAQTTGYWTRVNLWTLCPPGASTVSFPTQQFVGEKSRPGRPLLRDKITRFVVSVGDRGPLFFDTFRLERLDIASVRFEGLEALDFGPVGSPVMEGFDPADSGTVYSPGRGLGWQAARIWRSFDARQPEALTQDFLCPEAGAFRLDLPDGRYRVLMNVASPGAFWGEQQNYRSRAILANGRAVHKSEMDVEAFKRRYFRNARSEDRPGVDPYDRYLLPMSKWQSFEVEVTDGKLEIGFRGANWALCLSAMIVYPTAKAEAGERFVRWVDERRRFQFHNNFKQARPQPTGPPSPAKGYRLFARHFMDPPKAADGPREGELLGDDGLAVSVAIGEISQIAFSLQPGAEPLGKLDLDVGPLKTTGGKRLPKGVIHPGWLDHRIHRMTMDGSVYEVAPRYWHPTPAPAAEGVTRTFFLRVTVPPDCPPGQYAGTVTVRPASGEARRVPLAVTVQPFELAPIEDVAVGPWGCRIRLPWLHDDPATRAWNRRMYAGSLRVLREAGCTSFSGIPHVRVNAKDGRIDLDTADADREMAVARKAGFRHLISNYGAGIAGYRMYGTAEGPDPAAAKRGGFPDPDAFLKALYKALDAHAVANDWLPVAWCLCDEPIGSAIPPAVKNALAHRRAGKGLKRTFFMGDTSMRGDDPADPHYELCRALPIASLNAHDAAAISVIHEAGNRFSFYNGADRWTMGRYMKALVVKHEMMLRLVWHFHVAVGDPYYALDCREDDYCWFNTDPAGRFVPSMRFLGEIQPGLNDYRYVTTLQRVLKDRPDHPAAEAAAKVLAETTSLVADADRREGRRRRTEGRLSDYAADRRRLTEAILSLLR